MDTSQPKVLARVPQVDPARLGATPGEADAADSPAEAPKRDRLPGFDGRLINQRLATRLLIGGAVALLLVAIVPLAFRGDGDEQSDGHPGAGGAT